MFPSLVRVRVGPDTPYSEPRGAADDRNPPGAPVAPLPGPPSRIELAGNLSATAGVISVSLPPMDHLTPPTAAVRRPRPGECD